ncbi:MAG TPA: alpha/beta hydrolase [Candidatus Acidoferrales bacterium]|nr:alpha/beta hydrolase [Candidatus Acidoferrales bacterium]
MVKTGLVLLPGLDGTGLLFADFVAALGPDLDPIVVRYPPDAPLGYAELEPLVRKSLPSGNPFLLLGESFAGPLAISIAASAPPGLVGLILCCSFASNPRPCLGKLAFLSPYLPVRGFPRSIFAKYFMGRFASQDLASKLAKASEHVAPDVFRYRIRAVCGVDYSAKLRQLRVPILYLRASMDRIVPRSASKRIKRLAPSTRIVEIDAPHYLLQARPEAAVATVSEFARELLPGG